jgi:hypothetical protein
MTTTAPAITTTESENGLGEVPLVDRDRAAQAMYEAEVALHIAHQTRVDAWITAAGDRLHEAIVEHSRAVRIESAASGAHPMAWEPPPAAEPRPTRSNSLPGLVRIKDRVVYEVCGYQRYGIVEALLNEHGHAGVSVAAVQPARGGPRIWIGLDLLTPLGV